MKNYFTLIIAVLTVTTASAQITKGGKVLPKEYTIDTFTKEVTISVPMQTNTSGNFVAMYYSIATPSGDLKAPPRQLQYLSDIPLIYGGTYGLGMKTGWRFGMHVNWLLPGINQHMIEELDWGMNYSFEIGSNAFTFENAPNAADYWAEGPSGTDYNNFWDISIGGLGPSLTYHTPIKGLDIDAFGNLGLNMVTGGTFSNSSYYTENFDGISLSLYRTFGISVRYSGLYLALKTKSYNFNDNQYDFYDNSNSSFTPINSFFSYLPMRFTNLSFGFAF